MSIRVNHASAWLLCACLLTSSVAAQSIYKCGNTYSQNPCSDEQTPARIHRDTATTPAGLSGKELCRSVVPHSVSLKDAYSARIDYVSNSSAEAITVYGESIVARRYDVAMNAKNSYGAYTGAKIYRCYLSIDGARLIAVKPPPEF